MKKVNSLWKLFYIISAVILITFIVVVYHTYEDIRYKYEIKIKNTNNSISSSIVSSFKYQESILKILGDELLSVDAYDYPENGRKLIEELIRVNNGFVAFGLARYDGQLILVSSLPQGSTLPNLMKNQKSQKSFKASRNSTKMQFGQTYYMEALQQWVIPIRMAIKDAKGNIPLVMTAGIKIEGGNTALKAFLSDSMKMHLIRDDGFIQFKSAIAESDYEKVFNTVIQEELFQDIKKMVQKNSISNIIINKEYSLLHAMYLKDFNLYSVISVPMKEIYHDFQLHFTILLLGLLLLFIFLYFTFKKTAITEKNARNKILQYNKKLEKEVQKKTEEINNKNIALEDETNKFFNLSINLLLIADFDGNIIRINWIATNILGYTIEELQNKSFMDFIHPQDKQSTINEMTKLSMGHVVKYFENRYQHKNGTYVTLAWSANTNKSRTLIFASAQDITEFRKKEELLVQQSKMAAMGEMIENIAHQWKQPLSLITTVSTSIKFKNELEMLDSKEIDESMKNIIYASEHLNRTIIDFKDFFKSEKKKALFNIKTTFEKTFKLLESQFNSSNIKIIKNISDLTYLGYESELIQVLINILNNARDELIKQSKSKRLIFIHTIKDDKYIHIIIKDNAGGVPENLMDDIFASHFTTKEKSNGTGIGLYMSKMIMTEHMNGKIAVENVTYIYENINYMGAQFTVYIPSKTD